jgi:hypothetical protein
VNDESITKCAAQQITIEAIAIAESYVWSTGETTPRIQISDPKIYSVTLTGILGCTSLRTITVANTVVPVIEEIIRDGNFVTINATGNTGLRFS